MIGEGKILEDNLLGKIRNKTISENPRYKELQPIDYTKESNEQSELRRIELEKARRQEINWKSNTISKIGLPYFYEIIEKHQPLNASPYKKILEFNLNNFLKEEDTVKELKGKIKINTCVGTSIDQLFGIDGFITYEDMNHSYDKDFYLPPMYINFDLTSNPAKTESRESNKDHNIVILNTGGKEIGFGPNENNNEFKEVVKEHLDILVQELYKRLQEEYSKYEIQDNLT